MIDPAIIALLPLVAIGAIVFTGIIRDARRHERFQATEAARALAIAERRHRK